MSRSRGGKLHKEAKKREEAKKRRNATESRQGEGWVGPSGSTQLDGIKKAQNQASGSGTQGHADKKSKRKETSEG